MRLGEADSVLDPRAAAILKKAVLQAKDRSIDQQFDRVVELLQKDQLHRVENHGELDEDLKRCWNSPQRQ